MACSSCGKKRKLRESKSSTAKVNKLAKSIPAKPVASSTTVTNDLSTAVVREESTTVLKTGLKLSESGKTEKLHKINEQKRKNYIKQNRAHLIYKARHGVDSPKVTVKAKPVVKK